MSVILWDTGVLLIVTQHGVLGEDLLGMASSHPFSNYQLLDSLKHKINTKNSPFLHDLKPTSFLILPSMIYFWMSYPKGEIWCPLEQAVAFPWRVRFPQTPSSFPWVLSDKISFHKLIRISSSWPWHQWENYQPVKVNKSSWKTQRFLYLLNMSNLSGDQILSFWHN